MRTFQLCSQRDQQLQQNTQCLFKKCLCVSCLSFFFSQQWRKLEVLLSWSVNSVFLSTKTFFNVLIFSKSSSSVTLQKKQGGPVQPGGCFLPEQPLWNSAVSKHKPYCWGSPAGTRWQPESHIGKRESFVWCLSSTSGLTARWGWELASSRKRWPWPYFLL